MSKKQLTIKWLVAMIAADVDIFLLQNEAQTEDNDQETFTREEIRAQLQKTTNKVLIELGKMGCDINAPILFNELNAFFNNKP